MRLINTTTLSLTEFFGTSIPPYAILSHTWGPEEVSFQDFHNLETASSKAGFAKIEQACKQSLTDELEWCWVDTCCIDKSSSAELSEAINSMFAWYRNAVVCYAYLADVPATVTADDLTCKWDTSEVLDAKQKLCASRWFTRGWTLQELLAPEKVVFFCDDWTLIGDRDVLHRLLTEASGIENVYLNGFIPISSASIALRMSWMANRETTRNEDLAYCLLGIFQCNVPLLYGEGRRAFFRLQEEILKHSDDQSIFCWMWDKKIVDPDWTSVLAPCPAAFRKSGNFAPALTKIDTPVRSYSITNAGLSIWLPLVSTPDRDVVLGVLDVQSRVKNAESFCVCIPLTQSRIHERHPYPAMPCLVPPQMVAPGSDIFIACKPTGDLSLRRLIPFKDTTLEPLSNPNDFGFLFAIGSHGKYIHVPPTYYSSPNVKFINNENLMTVSFSGTNAQRTAGVAIFSNPLFPTRGDVFWLAVHTDMIRGKMYHDTSCGTFSPSEDSQLASLSGQQLLEGIEACQWDELQRKFKTPNGKTSVVSLGPRLVYSSLSNGSKNAQIVLFLSGNTHLSEAWERGVNSIAAELEA